MNDEPVNLAKQSLRKAVLAGRAAGHSCGHSHSQLLIDYAWENRVKTVACYISFGDEPSTNVFIKHCQLDERIKLYVPRVDGDNLQWVLMNSDQVKHSMGMSEPVGDAVALREVDLMIVPALATDLDGARLGRGKGFYDRALKQVSAKTVVALVHDDEVVPGVPSEAHDVSVDLICTCSKLIEI